MQSRYFMTSDEFGVRFSVHTLGREHTNLLLIGWMGHFADSCIRERLNVKSLAR
jgi:hypothetical protein